MLRKTRAFLRRLTGSGEDRRAHPRHEIDVETTCRSLADEADMPARIRNVSHSGINLVVPHNVIEGTMIRVHLPSTGEGPKTTVLACVTNARQTGDGQYSLGCMFSFELSDAEMRLLGGEKKASDASDQRGWVRCAARGTIAYRAIPSDDVAARSAELIDLSPAGVGLIVDQAIEAGTAITLGLQRQDEKPDRQMLACVVYVTDRSDGKWAIGCNFLHELSERELGELVWRTNS
jgi:hypothetical protein